MRLGKGEYQQACDANTKMRDVNVVSTSQYFRHPNVCEADQFCSGK